MPGGHVRELHPSLFWSVKIDDDIASSICRLAEDGAIRERTIDADMIVMATRRFAGQQRCGAGSVTACVLCTTWLPLLILRPTSMEYSNIHLFQDEAIVGKHE
jgi:nucleotide-binding universal stress UspA family protein